MIFDKNGNFVVGSTPQTVQKAFIEAFPETDGKITFSKHATERVVERFGHYRPYVGRAVLRAVNANPKRDGTRIHSTHKCTAVVKKVDGKFIVITVLFTQDDDW